MPKVAIGIMTYNLEKYISAAIDSVLCQETNFDYHILVADDASTDHTKDILMQYKNKYPSKITLLLGRKNVGSTLNMARLLTNIKEYEYFSFFDGDDLWAGSTRLQHQVDFLDSHSEYMLCSGQTQLIVNDMPGDNILPDTLLNATYSFFDYFKSPVLFHTSGILLRNVIYNEGIPSYYFPIAKSWESDALRGEDFRRLRHLEKGPLYVLPELVSYYRIHDKGIWSSSNSAERVILGAISSNFYKKYYQGALLGSEIWPYIDAFASQGYKTMWEILVNENYIYPECKLTARQIHLLTELLKDISTGEEIKNELTNIQKR